MRACHSTCPNEQDVIMSILSLHSVHGDLSEPASTICIQQDGPPMDRLHWLEHEGMGTHKTQNLIRIPLRTGELTTINLTGTLKEGENKEKECVDKLEGRNENMTRIMCTDFKQASPIPLFRGRSESINK